MKALPASLPRISVTPISRGPAVEMINAAHLAAFGVTDRATLVEWCSDFEALLFDVPEDRFALDVTAAYALGTGRARAVFVHVTEKHLGPQP